jgi:hypothetical protein
VNEELKSNVICVTPVQSTSRPIGRCSCPFLSVVRPVDRHIYILLRRTTDIMTLKHQKNFGYLMIRMS